MNTQTYGCEFQVFCKQQLQKCSYTRLQVTMTRQTVNHLWKISADFGVDVPTNRPQSQTLHGHHHFKESGITTIGFDSNGSNMFSGTHLLCWKLLHMICLANSLRMMKIFSRFHRLILIVSHSNTAEVSVQLSPFSECTFQLCSTQDERYQSVFHDLIHWMIHEDSSASSMRYVSLLEIYVAFRCSRQGWFSGIPVSRRYFCFGFYVFQEDLSAHFSKCWNSAGFQRH